jgi:tetratricopeptide (TPR) repeat protein
MTDDIPTLTSRLAAEPGSLAFLPLADALRHRGQLDAALSVAIRGSQRYPRLADAHDMVARIRSDRGEGDLAFDAWTEALRHDPTHAGALRGLAFLAFRSGDMARAAKHLEAALRVTPDDAGLKAALAKVTAAPQRGAGRPPPPAAGADADLAGQLLVDARGRRLSGLVRSPRGDDVSDLVAAKLGGVLREARRAAALLGLGEWRSLSAECPEGSFHLIAPAPDTALLAVAGPDVPGGRLALLAERGGVAARRWLEKLG